PAAEARSLVERFECTTRPKHGSWLDLVESELGVLSSQCLDPPGDGAHGDPGPFWTRCDDLSGADFGRRKQRCRAMPLVVVAPAGQGAAIGQLQIALRSLQGLDRGLLVHA